MNNKKIKLYSLPVVAILDVAFPFQCSAQLEFQNEMKWQ